KKIRTVRESRLMKVLDLARTIDRKKLYLIARTGKMSQFRATGGTLIIKNKGVVLGQDVAEALDIQPGDRVRISPLYGRRQ
ncbi:MAG: arginine N-succinyltransferase, partial [Candidatus Omnitrophica bacterium]|nr:arginine N-succinyltransferase [Candidatus Omnitrophota bacterium]